MVRLLHQTGNHKCGMHEEQESPEVREYESLATVRDILLLLYSEIKENTGTDCSNLQKAFEYMDGLTKSLWEKF